MSFCLRWSENIKTSAVQISTSLQSARVQRQSLERPHSECGARRVQYRRYPGIVSAACSIWGAEKAAQTQHALGQVAGVAITATCQSRYSVCSPVLCRNRTVRDKGKFDSRYRACAQVVGVGGPDLRKQRGHCPRRRRPSCIAPQPPQTQSGPAVPYPGPCTYMGGVKTGVGRVSGCEVHAGEILN